MDQKDILTLAIASAGLLLSLINLYRAQFRSADLTASLGPDFHFYYAGQGVPAVYLPVVFQNNSPVAGRVERAVITIETPEGRHFSMKWWDSYRIRWPAI
jgi:hypothetical protein